MGDLGMNQKDFALYLGIPQSTLSRYLQGGDARYVELVAITRKLNLSLLGEDVATYESRASPLTLADQAENERRQLIRYRSNSYGAAYTAALVKCEDGRWKIYEMYDLDDLKRDIGY